MADRCDVPGCEQDAKWYGPRDGQRCIAHVPLAAMRGEPDPLRSDVPMKEPHRHERPCANPFCAVCYPAAPRPWPIGEPDVAALCPECGRSFADGLVKCLHLGHSVPEESVPAKCAERTCEQNEGYGCQGHAPRAPAPLPIGEPERRLWRQRVAVALILQVEAERQARAAEEWARGYEKRRDEQHRLAAEAIGCDDCAWLRHQVDRLQRERDGFEASWRDARAWAEREQAAADAAHAALDATTERLVAAADILRRYGDIGAQAALRALEGETT